MLIKQVTELGRTWARAGLDRSRAVLESGADRLRTTAELLGDWSSKLTPNASEQEGGVAAASDGAESEVAEQGDENRADEPQAASN